MYKDMLCLSSAFDPGPEHSLAKHAYQFVHCKTTLWWVRGENKDTHHRACPVLQLQPTDMVPVYIYINSAQLSDVRAAKLHLKRFSAPNGHTFLFRAGPVFKECKSGLHAALSNTYRPVDHHVLPDGARLPGGPDPWPQEGEAGGGACYAAVLGRPGLAGEPPPPGPEGCAMSGWKGPLMPQPPTYSVRPAPAHLQYVYV